MPIATMARTEQDAVFQVETFDSETPYETIDQRQKALITERLQGRIPDTLLLGEHDHVLTVGRRWKSAVDTTRVVAGRVLPVVALQRGGEMTYHGPGQLIGYPVFHLLPQERDLHRYLRHLEEVLIRVLKHFEVTGSRKSGWTGVWVGEHKIASIGVAVKQWITFHGFALNLTTDLRYFHPIQPCGLNGEVMTSLHQLCPELSVEAALHDKVMGLLLSEMETVFQRTLLPPEKKRGGGSCPSNVF